MTERNESTTNLSGVGVESVDHKAGPRRANVRAHGNEGMSSMHADRTDDHAAAAEQLITTATLAVNDALGELGRLVDAEQFDERTYLMVVEARDMLRKAGRRCEESGR